VERTGVPPWFRRLTGVTTIQIVASFGRRDPLGVGAPARLRKVVDEKGIAADVKVYPDAGHSFANKLPGQSLLRITGFGYNDAATEDAYRRVFAFFNEHLAR
jgi:carboxymethylenebutenolidase